MNFFELYSMSEQDNIYMRRCFELARLGAGSVSPNPMVGSVIVYNGDVIGEGWHRKYGQAHAEVNAVASVKDKSLLKNSTIYVALEPCCHWGKTPPCAKLIIESGIRRCVIANTDPNPKVSGGGIRLLKEAGIDVVTGVLESEGAFLNRRFFTNQNEKRPYVILKYAETADGFIAPEGKGAWISNDALRVWVHRQRSEEDAIMVGYHTAMQDNPQLNVRYYGGRNPKRIVFDKELSLPAQMHLKDNSQDTYIFNFKKDFKDGRNTYIRLERNSEVVKSMLNYLYEQKICSLVVEGGRKTLDMFLQSDLWDEANVITGTTNFNVGIPSPIIPIKAAKVETIGNNTLRTYFNM